MEIDEELQRLVTAKENLRQAIIAKGGSVSGKLDNYPAAIRNL